MSGNTPVFPKFQTSHPGIPPQVLWRENEDRSFVFIVPPFEKRPNTMGTDHDLIQLLKYCQENKIQANIIVSVAEQSPRFLIDRRHFVTYHYKTGAEGKILEAKCYDSVRDMDNSGVTGVLSKIANAFRRLVGAKPKRFFSVDQQADMAQSIKDGTAVRDSEGDEILTAGQEITIQRHYSGVQKNDIDCGYWSAVIAMKLANEPQTTQPDLFKHLKKYETKEQMLAFKKQAVTDETIRNVGVQYKGGVDDEGKPKSPEDTIEEYQAKAGSHTIKAADEISKDKRTICSHLMGLLIADLVKHNQMQIVKRKAADVAQPLQPFAVLPALHQMQTVNIKAADVAGPFDAVKGGPSEVLHNAERLSSDNGSGNDNRPSSVVEVSPSTSPRSSFSS